MAKFYSKQALAPLDTPLDGSFRPIRSSCGPMISFRRPTAEAIRQFRAEQAELDFTYPAVRATANTPPAGYVVDHTRIKLGTGEEVFQKAKAGLSRWQHFKLAWVAALPNDTPLEAGQVIAVLACVLGIYWLNACRIVYVVDEAGDTTRFGFAYGTLPGHAESGEERFVLEWNRSNNEVWYDILAFSKPNYFVTRIAYPLVRRFQKRFARDSAAAMVRVAESTPSSVANSKS